LDAKGTPVPCDAIEAGKLLASIEGRCVACERTPGRFWVSTAFLVFDHNALGDGPPVLWNTYVYAPDGSSKLMGRYSSLDEAVAGHREAVTFVGLVGGAYGPV
jgi:hypothetical protein